MGEAILAASKLLHTALEQYSIACTSIASASFFHARKGWSNKVHQPILDQVANDIWQLENHKHALSQATVKLEQLRDARLSLIHALPEHILITIFQFALGFRPCILDGYDESLEFACPGLLSRVCSRWRQTLINARIFWSHIDLPLDAVPSQDFLDRAEIFASRARDIPLQIHITRLNHMFQLDDILPGLVRFLFSVATRTQSLDLYAIDNSHDGGLDFDARILGACLGTSKPGTLTELSFKNLSNQRHFIWPSDHRLGFHTGIRMLLSHTHLEEIWGPVTVLRLCGLLPYWTSRAYHNLTELHLDCSGEGITTTPISESQLVDILRASPKLRVLNIDLHVTDILPKDALIDPVRLDNLEIVCLALSNFDTILRWFSPGLSPLRLSLRNRRGYGIFALDKEIGDFHVRTSITHLRLIANVIPYQEIVNILSHLRDLQVLVLDYCFCQHGAKRQNVPYPCYNVCEPPVVCMVRCRTDTDGFRWMVAQKSAPKLTLWGCLFGHDSEPLDLDAFVAQHNVSHEFSSCSGVKFLTEQQLDPTGDWF